MALYNPISLPSNKSSTANSTTVTSSITSVTLLAENPLREGGLIWNNSTSNLLIDFDSEVSLTNFIVEIYAGGYYEVPFNYVGVISGIWRQANGSANIREFVA